MKRASDDVALMWMTFDQALGTCMPPDDNRLFWSQLEPSPLVYREVIRIQQEQLNCHADEADTLWSKDRVCMAGVPGGGRYASAHRVSAAALAACEQLAALHFVPAQQVAQLCQPSAMAVGRIKRHVRDSEFKHKADRAAASTSSQTRKSRAVAPLLWTDTVFVSEGEASLARLYPPMSCPAQTLHAQLADFSTHGGWRERRRHVRGGGGGHAAIPGRPHTATALPLHGAY